MYDELKSILYTNLTDYLDKLVACEFHNTHLDDDVIYDVCQIVDKSFEEHFFSAAPKTLDIDTPRWQDTRMIISWNEDTVMDCDRCEKPMFPNLSTWEDDLEEPEFSGCAWSCTTYGCAEFTGGEIEAEDLEALGVPAWIAERIEALSNAVLELQG